jgi:hypothetical protein
LKKARNEHYSTERIKCPFGRLADGLPDRKGRLRKGRDFQTERAAHTSKHQTIGEGLGKETLSVTSLRSFLLGAGAALARMQRPISIAKIVLCNPARAGSIQDRVSRFDIVKEASALPPTTGTD